MFTKAAVAAVAPFLLGMTHTSPVAEAVRSHSVPSILTPNFPVPGSLFERDPDPSPAPIQTKLIEPGLSTNLALPKRSSNVTLDQSVNALLVLGSGFEWDFACGPKNDTECYRRWWDFYRYCHPYDRNCYQDFYYYDDYYGSCKNYDKYTGKCYDRCYYENDNCDKYDDCKDNDSECYKKKRREQYCYPWYDDRYDPDCLNNHDPPEHYCRPFDYDCHRKSPYWGKPGFGRPGYDKPDDGKPDDGKPDDGKPDYGKPDYGKPDYGKPGYPIYKPRPPPYKPGYPSYKPTYPPHKPGYPHRKPGYPYEPDYPDKPDYPEEPGYPDPDKPNKPGKPKYPDPPSQPGYPEEPEYPDKPDEEYDYICYPSRDKDCYPEIPEFPDYDDDEDYDYTHVAKEHIVVKFYSKMYGLLYEEKVWPNGAEHYIEHETQQVDYIKYWAEEDEGEKIRCLPAKNWFPWGPLPMYSYKESSEDNYAVRTLELKKAQPVEVIRCDFL